MIRRIEVQMDEEDELLRLRGINRTIVSIIDKGSNADFKEQIFKIRKLYPAMKELSQK